MNNYIKILTFTIVIVLISTLAAYTHSVKDDKESLQTQYPWAVIQSDTIELGTIAVGKSVRGHLVLRNEGWHDLIIAGVRSSCGLMIPNWPTEPIRTKHETIISFRFNANRMGPFERKITLHTNAYQKTMVVTVLGEVVPAKEVP